MLHIASIVFVAVVAYILLVVQPFPILHDYPEWMYQGHIVHALLTDSSSALTQHFEWVPIPVPNSISQLAIGALNFIVSPVVAGKVWLGGYFLLVLVTCFAAFKAHRFGGAMQWLFTITIAFGPGFWNGYINFQVGLLLLALFIVTGLRRSMVWVFVFSILIYFSHASVFAAFICYVVLTERLDDRRPGVVVAILPSLALLLWYTSARLLSGGGQNIGLDSIPEWVQYKLYTLAKQGPFHNFIRPDGESLLATADGLYKLGFAINFIVAGLIGLWLMLIVWRHFLSRSAIEQQVGRGNMPIAKSVLGTVLVLILAWLLAGKNSFGVVNLGERFLIVGLMLLILTAECPSWLRRSWLALCGVVGLITLGSLVAVTQYAEQSYAVDRSGSSTGLESFVDDIYKSSRHKYFNHRLFIYANLGQYLDDPAQFDRPPSVDHESSMVRSVQR